MLGSSCFEVSNTEIQALETRRRELAPKSLSIKPKATLSKREMLENMIRTLGENPEAWLVKKTQAEPHRIIAANEHR